MAVKVHETGYGKWKVPVIIIAVIVVLGLVGTGILLSDSLGVSIEEGSKRIEVAEGDGTSSVAKLLKDNGIIKYPLLFKVQSKLGGYDGNFQPGAATIDDGMSYSDILNLIITPSREAAKITIPEGYEIKQIAQKLDEAGIVSWQDFYAALKPEYYERATELGLTVDEVITMASIVERETDSGTERAKVAGVFYNRRNSGMKFQSCATVQYILGERKPVLSIADTQIDSPYNTYMYAGFPIGPICNPGTECIEAALYPEATDAYYFVLGKDGSHIFSKTYEEHLAAMQSTEQNISVDDSAIENQDSLKQ